MIEVQHVSKFYQMEDQKIYALKDVSFQIEDGEFVIILGPSGAGKSTMLNLLGGIDQIDEGEILVNQHKLSTKNEKELTQYRADEIGFIFQFYNLIPTLNVLENVALMSDIKKDTLPAMQILKDIGLSKHSKKFPSQLSGGEQQRVSIARALSKNPNVLLCDEPTGALDSETGKMILILLQDMCRRYHKTTIIVTHNAAIAPCADKVIQIHNGRISSIIHQKQPLNIKEVEW
ncbi:ABC transporter ATP-binding protein [[Eubacterium] hominis]|uniref:ABC transporter ATP-binding protein n=1 Tax=[Eubacterium] hominis TaxID=2764325 RepID=UPI003A4E3C63